MHLSRRLRPFAGARPWTVRRRERVSAGGGRLLALVRQHARQLCVPMPVAADSRRGPKNVRQRREEAAQVAGASFGGAKQTAAARGRAPVPLPLPQQGRLQKWRLSVSDWTRRKRLPKRY